VPDFSDSLSFLILGSDRQVGRSLIQYLDSRQIPYQACSSEQLATTPDEVGKIVASAQSCSYVVNVLFEEPAEGAEVDLPFWLSLASSVANACAQSQKPLFQLSSGLVFAGKSSRAYVETDLPDAQSALGRTYIDIEREVVERWSKTVFLRASWLFSEQDGNYLTQLVGAAVRLESLKVSGHLRGCPTYAMTAAKVLVAIAEQVDCGAEPELWGVYHYADSDACTMHTFAKTVITVVKSMTEVKVESLEEGNSPGMIDAVNELENYELGCKKILSTFGIKQRPWRRSIHDVLKEKFSSQD